MITAFICIVIFAWLAVCAAKMIVKEFVCKDCILKRKCDEHRKETGKTFCDNNELNNYFNDYFHYPLA